MIQKSRKNRLKTINIFIVPVLFTFCFACSPKKSNTNKAATVLSTQKEEDITFSTVETILKQADTLSGKSVNVTGVIDHVCRHGGKRFKIISSDGAMELKIELDEEFKAVGAEIIGNTVKVTGMLIPTKMNAEMVKAWEKKVKKNHSGEENSEHFKQEISEIQGIYHKLISGEIPYYTRYSVHAESYRLE